AHSATGGRGFFSGSVHFFGVDPAHEFAELAAGDFDGVILVFFLHRFEVLAAALGFVDPLAGERAVLHFLEDLFHFLFGFFGDDARTAGVVAVLGGIAHTVTHVAE